MNEQNIYENIKKLENGLSLNEEEKKVFEICSRCCDLFEKQVIIRVAGGWVRDKILGLESDDLDFALENATGEEFSNKLKEIENVTVKLNPAKSQQLESAKVCFFGSFWVDMCQLRCDEYTENSRIPSIRVGTLDEDAHRRDITINCLYFNVNTKKVEDLCNGINDLVAKLVKTPVDTYKSFCEDPIRILRVFRFASRFGFNVDPIIIDTAPKCLEELKVKVTHPRIEQELEKALNGPDPYSYIKYLIDTKLFQFIFDYNDQWKLDENEILEMLRQLYPLFPDGFHFVLSLSVIYFSLYDNELVVDPFSSKKSLVTAFDCASKLIYVNRKIYDISYKAISATKSFQTLYKKTTENSIELTRATVGLWIREAGEYWRLCRVLSLDPDQINFFDNILLPFIKKEKLEEVWKLKPLAFGKALADIHHTRPGPLLNQYTQELIEWQISNPNGTLNDYKSYVQNK